MNMEFAVSVVIPTFRRDLLLRRCLEALLAQTLDARSYEVIIVDDGPMDTTRTVVEEYAARGHPNVIRYCAMSRHGGPAAARNVGWQAASAPIIAFTDDDCVPDPCWLERGIAAFDGTVDGVSGRTIVPVSLKPNDHERNTSFLGESEFVTANCFYRRALLHEIGGFDERFTRAWREDADLYFTLLSRNARLIHAADAIVVHPVRRTTWAASIREQSKSVFNALLFKKHPRLYCEKVGNEHRFGYYAIVASLLLFLFLTAFDLHALAAVPLSLWTTFTLAFCLKRLQGASHRPGHLLDMLVTSMIIPFLSVFWRLKGAVRFRVFFY